MQNWTQTQPRVRPFAVHSAGALLATAAAYLATAKLGLSMAFVAEQVTPVWPPTGIALAAVLLLGYRVWPGVLVGAFLANATANEPLLTAGGIAIGNTLEAVVGAWLLRRAGCQSSLARLQDVLGLLLLAATLSTTVSATIGVASLCLGGVQPWSAAGSLWLVWWIGDAMGDVVMAPFLLVWAGSSKFAWRPRRIIEAVTLMAGVVVVSLTVFAGSLGAPAFGYPLHYMIFPFVIWAALRFGPRGTATVTFAAATIAIWSTVNGRGPFAMGTAHESLIVLQLFMAMVAVSALFLGAAISERDEAKRRAAADYAELKPGEERLRLALDAGRMGVWDWDMATGAVKWSANLERIHGLAPGSFSGTFDGFQALVHPEDRDIVNRAIARAVEQGTGYEVEYREPGVADGPVHWVAGKGTVLRDAAGRPVRMIGVCMDISERKRAEEVLREADRRKDDFLGMLAHDLRNPLAALASALHLLRPGGNRGDALALAERQVKRLTRLVDDLLDVARVTQGKVVLQKEVVSLQEVVQFAVASARPVLASRGQSILLSLAAEPVHFEADRVRLEQILGNLLDNAAKYSDDGAEIRVAAARAGDAVEIRVCDTGAGIAPEDLDRIFAPFVQGGRSGDRAAGGLGIGLAVVRSLIELHGGTAEARSPGLGRGSEFIVRFPMPSRATAAEARAPKDAHVPAIRSLRLLLVEDNADVLEAMREVLGAMGHDVVVAPDGPMALALAETCAPDVVLLDIGLPGMDGYEVARRLRQRSSLRRTILVALTGYGREEDTRRATEAGFDEHLTKPVDPAVLRDFLLAVANGSERTATEPTVH